MTHRSALLLSLLLCSTSGFAAEPTAAKPTPAVAALKPIDIPFTKYVLANGLTLIVHEDHRAPAAAVQIWYHVGSKDETPGRTGFAHLYEHLMFNGSEHANDDWFKYMNPLGAIGLNGTTSLDRTNFFQTVPVNALDRLLWLESDRMGHMLGVVDQAKLDEQRGVVQNEKRQRSNSPTGNVPAMMYEATYPKGHPYSWTPIGSMEDLSAATLDDVKSWFKTWYGAGNAVIVISGDVKPEEVRAKVEHYFGAIPGGGMLKRNQSWIAKMNGEKRETVELAVPLPMLLKVWNTPGYGTRDAELLDIAGKIIGGGSSSRFYQRLVQTDKLASGASAGLGAYELGGQFTITASAKEGIDIKTVEKAIDEELARFLRDGPTAQELERIKFETYTASVRRSDSLADKGGVLAEGMLYAGRPDYYRTSEAWVLGATPADVRDAARKWLSDGVYALSAMPQKSYVTASADADRSRMPDIGAEASFALPPVRHATLSNGLKLQVVERHDTPQFTMQLIMNGGRLTEPGAYPAGVSSLATEMTMEGTQRRSSIQISERQQEIGASLGWGGGTDSSTLSMSGLTARLGESLDLFSDILINPIFPEADFRRQKSNLIDGLRQARFTLRGKAGLVLPRLVYGDGNPLAATPTEASYAAMTLSDLRGWYGRWIRPDNGTLLIVGDVTLEEIQPKLEQMLAGWKAPAEPLAKPAPLPKFPVQARPRIFLVDHPGAQQSNITVANTSVPRTDPDYEGMETINRIIGGGFISRLNMNLREDKHWSYGASASVDGYRDAGDYSVNAPVQTDKTADAMREINRELRDILGARKPTAKEIADAKDGKTLVLYSALTSTTGPIGYYRDLIQYGLPADYWNGYASRVKAFTPTQLQAAAAKMIRPDEMTWLVVGDLSKIEADIRKLGLAEVHVIDLDGKIVR